MQTAKAAEAAAARQPIAQILKTAVSEKRPNEPAGKNGTPINGGSMAQGVDEVGLYVRDREAALAASAVSRDNGWETTEVVAMSRRSQ
jgi:hypothetical protein